MSTARVFGVGAFLMLIWPATGIAFNPTDDPTENTIYFVGAFVQLFLETLLLLFDWLELYFPSAWIDGFGWILIGLMGLMWLAILLLPFFGAWNRRPAALWFLQFSYAGAQAICGWIYAKTVL